ATQSNFWHRQAASTKSAMASWHGRRCGGRPSGRCASGTTQIISWSASPQKLVAIIELAGGTVAENIAGGSKLLEIFRAPSGSGKAHSGRNPSEPQRSQRATRPGPFEPPRPKSSRWTQRHLAQR